MVLKITEDIDRIIRNALREDIGRFDITTDLFIPENKKVKAVILCRESNVIVCGLPIAKRVFKLLDKNISFKPAVEDGTRIRRCKIVAELQGGAKDILTAERTALNFLSILSGIATFTYRFKEKIKPSKVKIMDTRKTSPGLRILEKYAVRVGGGYNHRFRLDEMILIKDNHLKVLGGIEKLADIFKNVRKRVPHLKIEIETKNIKEFIIASSLNPDIIMLDNMNLDDIKRIVSLNRKNIKLEVSGNINLRNIKEIAKTGIDMISIGAITHSAKAIDFSLEII